MQDYKIITENDQYFLACFDENGAIKYQLLMSNDKEAHKFRLALSLGTHPGPLMNPHYYQKINDKPLSFKPIIMLAHDQEDHVATCCHSGCPNCPWS